MICMYNITDKLKRGAASYVRWNYDRANSKLLHSKAHIATVKSGNACLFVYCNFGKKLLPCQIEDIVVVGFVSGHCQRISPAQAWAHFLSSSFRRCFGMPELQAKNVPKKFVLATPTTMILKEVTVVIQKAGRQLSAQISIILWPRF